VIHYARENSGGALLSNFVRSLAVDERGLWIGYFPESGMQQSGLGFTTKKQWLSCNFAPGVTDQLVNDVLIDGQGNVWVATETAGVSRYDGESWQSYGQAEGLPSKAIYGLGMDHSGQVWAGTWEGVAVFVDGRWEVPYSVANNTLFNNHVHAIAFDSQQNIWIGHIGAGISEYDNASGSWIHHTVAGGNLGGDHTRDILVRKATENDDEQVWIATADGGVTRFENGEWTVYRTEDGLPSDDVVSLAIDRYHRVWAATAGGVAYFDGVTWQLYHTLHATAVAIGLSCDECPINDDMVWTATREHGLTYSKLPLDMSAVDVIEVRYPKTVAPGEKFRPEIVVAPRSPYELREDRGDMLVHIDADESNRFGAWQHIPAKDIVRAGEPFIFTDHDRLFVAPQLGEGETEKTFTSTWRVWMNTRFVGPPIQITFTVKKPDAVE
jgi:frataxin-like iron-binding protein CyaY